MTVDAPAILFLEPEMMIKRREHCDMALPPFPCSLCMRLLLISDVDLKGQFHLFILTCLSEVVSSTDCERLSHFILTALR
jgi:hypothetical protein